MRTSPYPRLEALERWSAERVFGWSPRVALVLGVAGVLAAGALDYGAFKAAGYDFAVTALYIAPVGLAAWAAGRRAGWLIAALAAAAEALVASARSGGVTRPLAFAASILIELLVFLGAVDLLSLLRLHLENERRMSRTDDLTGIGNSRALTEGAAVELERSRRRGTPISTVYLDVDDFKLVNDSRGHAAGNALLRVVGESLRRSIRGHDLAARVGGDEFVLLLTETGPDQARFAVERVRRRILEGVRAAGFAATVSVGVATFRTTPLSVDELLRAGDAAMYRVKNGGKGGVHYEVVDGPPVPPGAPWERQRARA
jgi:diguanylate cyclase (GGDEF)-like protein